MRLLPVALSWLALLVTAAFAQDAYGGQGDYGDNDYGQPDSLYHDYAARQEGKGVAKQGLPWGTVLASAGAGWFLGSKFHCRRLRKTLNEKHKQEQKALYKQYYTDVYTLQQQNAELVAAIEQMGFKTRS